MEIQQGTESEPQQNGKAEWPVPHLQSDPPKKRIPAVLIPPSLLNFRALLLVCVVPQLFLVAINLDAWRLASGDANATERGYALALFCLQLGTLLFSAGIAAAIGWQRRSLSRWEGAYLLIPPAISLPAAVFLNGSAIPSAVADWMLPPEQWVMKQFALVMPAALLGAFRILCPDREENPAERSYSLARSLAMGMVFIATSFGVLFVFVAVMTATNGANFVPPIFGGFLIILSTLAAAGVLQTIVSAYVWARSESPVALVILTFFVAVAAPIGGLALNALIPFPTDLQLPIIYIMALLNGVILMLPNFADIRGHRVVWLLQCAAFPFTIYFFLVFLPWIPAAPLAVIAMGGGFLIYTPTALFLLHGYRILDGFHAEVRGGGKVVPALLGITAMLIWPGVLTTQALLDRTNLHRALDYTQYPDFSANSRFEGSPAALQSALVHMRDFKEGIYLPYLSEYYNRLVFDGLVLPTAKMNDLQRTFFGTPMPEASKLSRRGTFLSGPRRGSNNVTETLAGGPMGERPSRFARTQDAATTFTEKAGVSRALSAITMVNPSGTVSEYHATISMPPGVLITGIWLTIGTERVPGRIFEQKAAQWVYQKITETRPVPKDPAILRIVDPTTATLSVYPVNPNETRLVEIEFTYPTGQRPEIRIDESVLPLPESVAAPSVAASPDGRVAVSLPAMESLPSFTRKPISHIVVDASLHSQYKNPKVLADALRHIASLRPDAAGFRVTFANFETRDAADGRVLDRKEIMNPDAASLLAGAGPFRGSMMETRVIREIYWRHHLAQSQPGFTAYTERPEVILLRSAYDKEGPAGDNLPWFAKLVPDSPSVFILSPDLKDLTARPLDPSTPEKQAGPVHIVEVSGERFAAPANAPASYVTIHRADEKPLALSIYDPASKKFGPLTVQKLRDSRYEESITPWSMQLARFYEPSQNRKDSLLALLDASRQTGTLVPAMAYMVVENNAQWEILERTQKKTTKGHEAMELTETPAAVPEPGTMTLLALGIIALVATKTRSSRRTRK